MQKRTQSRYNAWDRTLTDTPEAEEPERRTTLADIVGALRQGQSTDINQDANLEANRGDIQLMPTQDEQRKQKEGLLSKRKDERSHTGAGNMAYEGSRTNCDDVTSNVDDVTVEPPEKDLKEDKRKGYLRKIIPMTFLVVLIIGAVLAVIFAVKNRSGQEISSAQTYHIKMKLDDMDYLPQMSDPKNKLFETLQFAVCETIKNILSLHNLHEDVTYCHAYNFTKGSVIAWIKLSINTTSPEATFRFLDEDVPVIMYNRRFNKQYVIVPFDVDPNYYNVSIAAIYAEVSSVTNNNSTNQPLISRNGNNNINHNDRNTTADTYVVNITTEDITHNSNDTDGDSHNFNSNNNNNYFNSNNNDNSTGANITVVDPFSKTNSTPTILVTRVIQQAQVAMSSSVSISDRPYLKAYSNKTSPEFREMQSEFCGTVTTVLEAETEFSGIRCLVDDLSLGSIVVNFTIGFNSTEEISRERMEQFIADAQAAIGKIFNKWMTRTLDIPELNAYNITYILPPKVVKYQVHERTKQDEVKLSALETCDDFNGGCEHGCSMVYDVISCSCRHGFRLASDKHHCIIDPCTPNPCQNGAMCTYVEDISEYKCVCPTEYSGINCETEICQAISVEQCKNTLPYSSTMLPNANGISHQNEMEERLEVLGTLPEGCERLGLKLLCSFYLPECTGGGNVKYPCKESCEHFVDECAGEFLNKTFCLALPSSKEEDCHEVEGFQAVLPVRLVGGASPSEGVVQVFGNSQWSEICDPDWSSVEATVVCRSLGFRGLGTPIRSSHFKNQASGNAQIGNVTCSMENQHLKECKMQRTTTNCNQKDIAAVICQNFEVRLVGPDSPRKGRVEVKFNGKWGTICDDHWNNSAAEAVCNMLGYSGRSIALSASFFGSANDDTPIWLDDVMCPKGAASLTECRHLVVGDHNCKHHNEDACVICEATDDDIPKLEVRLVNGSTPLEGRVEVKYDGVWGTVCDDNWSPEAAYAVCAMLGHTKGTAYPTSGGSFGAGTGPILLDDVVCDKGADWLLQCSHQPIGQSNCQHREDAGVICGANVTSTIRLVGGSNSSEGRVEVYMDGVWGTVCDDFWDDKDASVVCNMLQISGRAKAIKKGQFGPGTGPIHLDDVGCTGQETTLFDCPNRGFGISNCEHKEDAGVICGLEPFRIDVPVPPTKAATLPTTTVSTTTTAVPSITGQCTYPVTIEECKGHVPWNFTYQHRQVWLQDLISLHRLKSLFTDRCYKYAGAFLCSYFVGGCSANGLALPPCKQLCEEFVDNCNHQLPRTFIFLCDFLPDGSSGLPCVSKHSLIYSTGLQGSDCPFHCNSGECLPADWVCDGVPDCPVGEDEQNCTGSLSSVSCDFETSVCGWQTADLGNDGLSWRRVTRKNTTWGWPSDHTTRFDGYFLYLSGQTGANDQTMANISTPQVQVASPKCLTFYAMAVGQNVSIVVFAKYANGSAAKILTIPPTPGSMWSRQSTDLPLGTFQLELQGLCGRNTIVAVDDVNLEIGKCPAKTEYIVRLEHGFNSRSGVIRIKGKGTSNKKERFKRICSDGWDDFDALVVCRQISVSRKVKWVAAVPVSSSHFNFSEISDFGLTRVKCKGLEDNIGQCKHEVPQTELCRGKPAGVMCVSGVMTYRLVEGHTKGHGRLEMFMDGTWFNLCEQFWNTREIIAVCQNLGFISEGRKVAPPSKPNRLPQRPTLALNITCPRREMDIKGCGVNWKKLNVVQESECAPLWLQCETGEGIQQISHEPPNCDFESPDLCGYEIDKRAALRWVQHNTSTPSSGTGPDIDPSLSGGHFLYMEASSPAKPNDFATIQTKSFNVTTPKCVRFFYHMHGKDVGSLSVYSYRGSKFLLAHLQEPTGNMWRPLSLRLGEGNNQYLLFTATRGNGYHGDIAIDDVVVGDHVCFEFGCGPGYFLCDDGGCIPDHLVGNNYPDCQNGTDEQRDPDNALYFACGDGVTLPIEYSCNGYPDCENGQDEKDCDCLDDEVVCQNGRCVSRDFICDGLDDCGDGSDELNCECEPGYKQCKNGGRCLKEEEVCGWSSCFNNASCAAHCNFTGNLCNYNSVHKEEVYWAAVQVPSGGVTNHWAYMDSHADGLDANLVSPVQVLPSGGCLVFDYFGAPENDLFFISVNTSATASKVIWKTKGSPLPENVASIRFERVHLQLPNGRIAVTFTGMKKSRSKSNGGFALDYVDILNRPCTVTKTVPGVSCNFSSGSTCKWSSAGLSFKDDGVTLSNDSLLKGRLTAKYNIPIRVCMTIRYKEAYGGYILTGLGSHYNNRTGFANLGATSVFGPFITNTISQSLINISRGEDEIFIDLIRGSVSSLAKILSVDLKEGVCQDNPQCYGYSCKNAKQCVANEKVCDGIPDCLDQSDETECRETESYHTFRSNPGYQTESSNNNYRWRQWWGSSDTAGPTLSAKHRVGLQSVSYPFYQGDEPRNYFHIHGLMGCKSDKSKVFFNVPRVMHCVTFSYSVINYDALYVFANDAKIWQAYGKEENGGKFSSYRDTWQHASIPLTRGVTKVAVQAVRGLGIGSVSLDNVVFTAECRSDTTCPSGYFSCGDGKCLSPSNVCDGISDCFDNKDETGCPDCNEESHRRCGDGQCVNKTLWCNGNFNCYDGADENNCNCKENEFQCSLTKKCIAIDNRCDGYLDCNYNLGDTSDEENCNRTDCGIGYFPCTSTGLCLPSTYVCNGENDCGDQSDERHPNCSCDKEDLRCDGQCVPPQFICDGRQHCSDNSDEKRCGKFSFLSPSCSSGHARCLTGECAPLGEACYGKVTCQIAKSEEKLCQSLCKPFEFECDGQCHDIALWSNGVTDCSDGQDEAEGYSCHPTLQLACDNGQCFMSYQYCDGILDCPDGTDEPPHCSCHAEWHFQCREDSRCIPKHKQCDGVPDCSDDSDEQNCTCTKSQISCDMGMCIDKSKWCDGVAQCPDESDEKLNCSANCTNTQFLCPDRCIPQSMRCDGRADCSDNSDEIGCKCMNWEFQCNNGMCIDKTLVCNHADECGDNSDERDCPCKEDQWRCGSGKCILREWLCDGEQDCPSGEDEKMCGVCNDTQFRCKKTLDCINSTLRCDGIPHCKDESDEHACVVSSNITVGNAAIPIVKIYHQGNMVPVCATRWRASMSEVLCRQIGQGSPISTTTPATSSLGNPVEFQRLLSPKENVMIIDKLQGNFQSVEATQCASVVSIVCQRKDCGKRQISVASKLVVGGEFAELGSWPWMISLRIFNRHHCGGTLIDDKWIVSAAHCLEAIAGSLSSTSVLMGSLLRTGNDTNAAVVYLDKYYAHPGYNGVTFENDIALLKLGKRVTFTNFIQPACLPGLRSPSLTDRCYVTGWGRVHGQSDQLSARLKEAKMKVMSHSLCHSLMDKSRPVVDRIMTCAGYAHGHVAACHADSGGPLVCQDEHGRWTVDGVISWATANCTGTPTVFSRVSAYTDWLERTMAENG